MSDRRMAPTTALNNPLMPVHLSTGKVLETTWVGQPLTCVHVTAGVYAGPHFILHLGYGIPVTGEPVGSKTAFIVRYPVEGVAIVDPAAKAEAEKVANAMMHMVNMRRSK